MKTVFLSLAVLAALAAAPAMADPNEPCKGNACPDTSGEDKGK